MGYPSGLSYMSPVSATATTITPDLTQVTYASGDLLVIGLVHDDGGATNITESSAFGWTLIGGTAAQVSVADGARSALAYKFATSSAESNPTFTGAASQEWAYGIQVFKDIHQTGTIEGWQRTDFNNVASIASNAPTASSEVANAAIPVLADSTVLVFAFADAALYFMRGLTDQQTCLGKSQGTPISMTLGHFQPDAAGTVPNFDTYISAADRSGSVWVVSFKNAASGTIAPYCRTGMDEFAWYGSWNSITPNPTWATLSTLVGGATINGISVSVAADGSADAPTVTNATANTFTPWGNSTNIASLENSASIWVGRSHAITSKNMSGKIFACQVEHDQASPYIRMGSEGVIVGFSDGTEWVIYQLFSKATIIARATPTSFQIALGNATVYDASDGTGAAMDWTAVTSMGWGYHRAGSSGTTQSISIKNACLLGGNTATAVGEGFSTLYGGSSSVPCTYRYLKPALESWGNYDLSRNQADSQIDAFASVVIGGLNATYFDSAGYAFTFPSAKNTTSQTNWNGLANCVGLTINANSTDTISVSGGLTASGLQQGFTIHASSDTGATYNFAGPIFRLLPTWKTGVECEDVSFSNCGKVALSGADATNLTIIKTTATDAPLSIAANGVVINGGTISATRDTGAATTYNVMLGASVTDLELNGVTLSGTPSGDRIYSALASGTLTITLDGTGTSLVAGDVTFVGGSTAVAVIAAPELYQAVTVSGAIANSQIHVADVDYTLTVSGITVTPTAGATYTHNDITWTVVSASITAGAGTIVVYGLGSPSDSGTLTKASGTGDASVAFSAFVRNITTLYKGAPTFPYTWTDSVAAATARAIRLRVGYCQSASARTFIEAYIGVCGITDGSEAVSYNASQVADTTYNTHALDGPAILALGEITVSDLGTDLITVDTAGGTMGWPTIYAAFVAWMASDSGIDDEIAYCDSPDPVNFIWENTRIKCPLGTALSVTDGWGRDSVTGLSITLWDNTGGAIGFSADHGIGYSTGSGLTTAQNAKLMALPAAVDIAEEVVNGITF